MISLFFQKLTRFLMTYLSASIPVRIDVCINMYDCDISPSDNVLIST